MVSRSGSVSVMPREPYTSTRESLVRAEAASTEVSTKGKKREWLFW